MKEEIKINEFEFHYFLKQVKLYIEKVDSEIAIEEKDSILDYIKIQEEIQILKIERDSYYKLWKNNQHSTQFYAEYKSRTERIKKLRQGRTLNLYEEESV